MISAVDQVLNGLLTRVRTGAETAAPVAARVPVRSADTGHIEPCDEPEIATRAAARTMADGPEIIEAEASASAIDAGHGRPWNFVANLIVKRVTFSKGNHGGIFARGAQRTLLHQRILLGG